MADATATMHMIMLALGIAAPEAPREKAPGTGRPAAIAPGLICRDPARMFQSDGDICPNTRAISPRPRASVHSRVLILQAASEPAVHKDLESLIASIE